MWAALGPGSTPKHADSRQLAQIGIRPFRTGHGIYLDVERTRGLAPGGGGVTLSILHTGSRYADDLDETGLLYHYPSTKRMPATRDQSEIDATKAAMILRLPIFVITGDERERKVHLGWVVGCDDDDRIFLLEFAEAIAPFVETFDEEHPFKLIVPRRERRSTVIAREGQPYFKFSLIRRYAKLCALCPIREVELLEAAHLCPVSDGGCNDPRNGLVLCRNHHRAIDCFLMAIEPGTQLVRRKPRLATLEELGVANPSINHLRAYPHPEALEYLWAQLKRRPDYAPYV